METWVNVQIEIKNLCTTAPTYYLNALLEHIKGMVENELNTAPDNVVDTFEDTYLNVQITQKSE